MYWNLSVKAGKTVILTTLGYMLVQTTLFAASFNLFRLPLRIIAVIGVVTAGGYALHKLWRTDFNQIIQPIKINWVWLILALSTLLLIHLKGPLSFNEHTFNFDWEKYNLITHDIAQQPFSPRLNIGAGQTAALAYYYAIYLPAGYVGFFVKSFVSPTTFVNISAFTFEAWLLLGQILALLLLPLVMQSLFGERRPLRYCGIAFVTFVLFAQMDGWEYLWRAGTLYQSDIEWGPAPWFFAPLRLQSFLSYSFWLPGHLTGSLLGLFILSIFKKLSHLKLLPLFLIYTYTLSTSLFGFISIQLFLPILWLSNHSTEIISLAKAKYKDVLATILGCSLILVLYGLNTIVLSPQYAVISILKYLVVIALVISVLHISAVRHWLNSYWFILVCVAIIGQFATTLIHHTDLFSTYRFTRYLLFFGKEFLHFFVIFLVAELVLSKKIILPKIIILAFGFIVLLTLSGKGDFIFSGSIGALMLFSVYLSYLIQTLAEYRRWQYYCILSAYLIAIAPSLYSIYFETFATIHYQTNIPIEQRIEAIRPQWIGLFQKNYTSPYVDDVRL